jgi:hypothetical protein
LAFEDLVLGTSGNMYLGTVICNIHTNDLCVCVCVCVYGRKMEKDQEDEDEDEDKRDM